MVEAGLLVKPPTRRAVEEALENVRRLRPQALLLNLPEDLEDIIISLSRSEIDYDEFLNEAYELLPEPKGAWLKEFEVLLRDLSNIGEMTDVYCYLDHESFREMANTSIEIALLTLREAIREEIDVADWVKVLERSREGESERWDREINKIIKLARDYERTLCISGFEARYIKKRLTELGVNSWIKYLGQPYHFTPIEILKRHIMMSKIDEEILKKLVREHLKFLREYVYKMSYMDAVEKWVKKKLYWLPAKRMV
ncbi:MAG: hypothetical protein NZ929_02460 [Aigarchaeota archaeon]|nr:hypothetical protein [Aigarchaeota archaeon]MDW7986802.1 hypothetical protein [Nitrososphaerota archaeon]